MDETAEIILVAEQLAAAFSVSLAESGLDLEVTSEWEVIHDTATMTGRKVLILPTAYRPVAPASRKIEDTFDVDVSILILEKFADTPRPQRIPRAWVNERVTWIQEKMFNPLANVENPLMLEVAPNSVDLSVYWSQTVEVTEVCHIDWLKEHKVFWSEVEATFRRIK